MWTAANRTYRQPLIRTRFPAMLIPLSPKFNLCQCLRNTNTIHCHINTPAITSHTLTAKCFRLFLNDNFLLNSEIHFLQNSAWTLFPQITLKLRCPHIPRSRAPISKYPVVWALPLISQMKCSLGWKCLFVGLMGKLIWTMWMMYDMPIFNSIMHLRETTTHWRKSKVSILVVCHRVRLFWRIRFYEWTI